MATHPIIPSLWFNNNAEEAVAFYRTVFPNSVVVQTARYGPGGPLPEGSLLSCLFELNGNRLLAFNGGPQFQFNEALSLSVLCDSQDEIDHYWQKLAADGGTPSQCGWLKDKYGLWWQVVPRRLSEMLSSAQTHKAGQVLAVLMQMSKLEIDRLEEAFAA